jgi:hypothetical protein
LAVDNSEPCPVSFPLFFIFIIGSARESTDFEYLFHTQFV